MAQYDIPSNNRASVIRTARRAEKRKGDLAVPLNLRELLNRAQIVSLRQMESFGWRLAFVRRSKSNSPIVVVKHPDLHQYGRLEEDGSINTDSSLNIRH